MSKMIKELLKINEWLELIKEDKNLNGAYICISQYLYLDEKENQELKKQVEDKTEDYRRMKDNFDSKVDVLTKIETQQKEFINYLEGQIKTSTEMSRLIYKNILQKYKEIIGENSNDKII